MMKMVRKVGSDDKVLIAAALLNAGVKARLRVFGRSVRIVFAGDWAPVATALNNEGYLNSGGGSFGRTSFSCGQVSVYLAAH